MLTIRRRGKNGSYYIRGSVTLGDKSIVVKEFSIGTSDADAASHLMAEYETTLRKELMFGPSAKLVKATIADAFNSYLSKTPPPCPSDVLRVGKLNSVIGDMKLDDLQDAWNHYRVKYLSKHKPAGQDRYRAVLQAAANVYRSEHRLDPTRLKGIKFKNQRVRFLSLTERDRLIAAYASHVQPIATMLAFHGPRIQTALQIRWGAMGVDMNNKSILFEHFKTSNIQAVPMHDKVYDALLPLWLKAGRKPGGHVFLNCRGMPYQDTRKSKIPGGNPLKRTHATALRRAKIENFTVHDWRHHWASHCVRAGIDLITIQKMGGWASLRMVERYAAVSFDHMRESIAKLS